MSDDNFDDGLIHAHSWASTTPHRRGAPSQPATRQPAHASGARIPSTTRHDDHIFE